MTGTDPPPGSTPGHDALAFVHDRERPAADLQVFDSLTREFLGTSFTFRVVGSSHFVSAPSVDFYELSSCEPVTGETVTTVPLATGSPDPDASTTARPDRPDGNGDTTPTGPVANPDRRIRYERPDLVCETVVCRRPLAAFPETAAFDLRYRFGPDAVTTVTVGEDWFDTYHTYPEFDLAVYTRTTFERIPTGALAGDTGDRVTDGRDEHDGADGRIGNDLDPSRLEDNHSAGAPPQGSTD